jgi:hypothetical protein
MATDQQHQGLPIDVSGELELEGSDFAQEVTDESRPKKKIRQNTPGVDWNKRKTLKMIYLTLRQLSYMSSTQS